MSYTELTMNKYTYLFSLTLLFTPSLLVASDFILFTNPPANIRDSPQGKVYCTKEEPGIAETSAPKTDAKGKKWYPIRACGKEGFVHESEARAISTYNDLKTSELIPLANTGNPVLQHKLGERYRKGNGVEKNNKKAIEWYKKSAEKNYANAQNSLGISYIAENPKESKKWFEKAAKQGHPVAQNTLGNLYKIDGNLEEAFKWLELARNNPKTVNNLNLLSKVEEDLSKLYCSANSDKILKNTKYKINYMDGLKIVEKVLTAKTKELSKNATKANQLSVIGVEACLSSLKSIISLNHLDGVQRAMHLKDNPQEVIEKTKVSVYKGLWDETESTIYINWSTLKGTGGEVEGVVMFDDSDIKVAFIGSNKEKGKLFLTTTKRGEIFTEDIILTLTRTKGKSYWQNNDKKTSFARNN